MKILVVDDDREYLDMIEMALKKAFNELLVEIVDNGKDAISKCNAEPIDLIFLDVNMPKMSGINVANILKNVEKTSSIPIIFVTSNSYADFADKGFEMGSIDYISKPIDINLLLNRVALYITIIKQQKSLEEANAILKKRVDKAMYENELHEQMLIHQSKTSVMGEMIGAIAHQWRQPLNIIATSMINLETKAELGMLDLNEIKRIYTKINTTLQFLSKTIDDFRNFFLTSNSKEKINLVQAVNYTIDLVSAQFKAHNIAIEFVYNKDESYMIDGYFNEFRQVVLNLFANSKDAIEARMKENEELDGYIKITLSKVSDSISLTFCDNGGGISPEIQSKIFNPYFTTKFAGQGTGIGLYLSKSIIEKFHNGTIEVYNKNDGACFEIKFKI
ncbi:response regulator [Arcobacter sp. FWKO B]|uniref:ATP-binding response regulator n=1 Tax=Arcobacter sp. FWKO B TaxID=2593672 RepID=UPI0018A50D8D|nr:response regulator [Arcobacter sp. FWKO B]QOG11213.1 hybrid sensor histidine kinase/response regulator [Arcobacter sp. FWKO B]